MYQGFVAIFKGRRNLDKIHITTSNIAIWRHRIYGQIDQPGVRVMDYKNSSPEPQDDGERISGIVCGLCTTCSPEPIEDGTPE